MPLAKSPAGPIEAVPNLKKRQRAIYYRPIKDRETGEITGWEPTQPLPSDMIGRELYLAKGFRLSPPKPGEELRPQVADTEKETLYAEIARLRLENSELKEKPKRAKKQ